LEKNKSKKKEQIIGNNTRNKAKKTNQKIKLAKNKIRNLVSVKALPVRLIWRGFPFLIMSKNKNAKYFYAATPYPLALTPEIL
jgi:hypothetical protein